MKLSTTLPVKIDKFQKNPLKYTENQTANVPISFPFKSHLIE
jgi:hypothetical protein